MSTDDPLVAQLRDEIAQLQARLLPAERKAAALEAVFSSMAEPVLVYDTDGTIVSANPALLAMIGLDLAGHDIAAILRRAEVRHPDGTPMTLEDAPGHRALRGESIANVRYDIVDAHGVVHKILGSAAPIRSGDQITGAVAILHDITEPERLAEESQRHANLLDAVVDSIGDGVVIYHPDGGVVRSNAGARRILGHTDEQMHLPFSERLKLMQPRLPSGEPITYETSPTALALRGESGAGLLLAARAGDTDRDVWLSMSYAPARDAAGEVVGAVITFSDVTPIVEGQRQAERLLADVLSKRERLFAVLSMLPGYVCLITPDHDLPYVNDGFRRLFGDPGKRKCFDAVYGRDDPCPWCESFRCLETGEPHTWEWTAPDGATFQVYDHPFSDVDGATVVLELGIDISEQKRIRLELLRHRDQLEALVDERTAELARRSHHLRSLAAELALTEERQRRHIAAGIHDEISQTLAFSKLQLEGLEAAAASEGEAAALADIVGKLSGVLEYTRDLTFEISPPILYQVGFDAAIEWLGERMTKHHGYAVTVTADEEPRELSEDARIVLFQGVREILTNVAKHARASEVAIEIGRDGDEMRVVLEDNGVGFDTSKPMVGGVTGGFGLFDISERLAHLGGHLSISSTLGTGSTFTLTAPLLSD